jgi:hypothetical protein
MNLCRGIVYSQGVIYTLVKNSQKLLDFIKDGSAIIESSYFEPLDSNDPTDDVCEPTDDVCEPTDDDWIQAFIERCEDDDGEALQEVLDEEEDEEIISFLQECKSVLGFD